MPTLMTISLVLTLFGTAASAQKGGARPPSPCKHWKAWYDVQPGTNPPTLHVTATCKFPTAGYTVELVPVQAKNAEAHPEMYVLKRVVHKPEGMAAQVITDVPLDYKLEASTEYKEVRIQPDKVRVRVTKVQ
jgi:hypothetical protein